jgi:hypothetical protein
MILVSGCCKFQLFSFLAYMTEEVDEWVDAWVAHSEPVGDKPHDVDVLEPREEEEEEGEEKSCLGKGSRQTCVRSSGGEGKFLHLEAFRQRNNK